MATTDARVIDLLDGDMYSGDPSPTYAWLRENAPVYWDELNELWGISRYDDILEIEKAKDVFINSDLEKGGYRPNLPADPSIIGLDDPMHTGLRGAALLAGIALGDVDRANARDHAPVDATFTPDPDAREEYERLYAEFTQLYKVQKDMFHRLNRPQKRKT